MFNCTFTNTDFTNVSFGGIYPISGVTFSSCEFSGSGFYTVAHNNSYKYKSKNKDILFQNCNLSSVIFEYSNLENSNFHDCKLWGATFLNCSVSKKTFFTTKSFEKKNPKAIAANFDLLTIKKSLKAGKSILKKYFGIFDDKLLDIASKIETKTEYFSAFISYSFNDKSFASSLHEYLLANNITCFLWEKDAPGGKYLKEIMSSQIKKHEKIIFISSVHSLKSEACQFELSEDRQKQNLDWNEAFIPVYIDNYLFSVQEHQVRPLEKSQEYWKNIVELKNINCINGTDNSTSLKRTKIFANIANALKK
jgi:hypothetical protein